MISLSAYHQIIFKEKGADVRVRVRSGVVTVQVEQTVVAVLVVVTANVQHHARSVIVAVVAHSRGPKPHRHGRYAPFICYQNVIL